MTNGEYTQRGKPQLYHIQGATLLVALLAVGGCSSVETDRAPEKRVVQEAEPFAHATSLLNQGNYEAAFKENQRLLWEKKAPADVALFNMGLISVHSSNPKKDYPRALASFKTLALQHPSSPFAEQVKIWVQVIEEHQRLADERQKLVEEKRSLTREREALSQEREKLKYVDEKSRQLDLEIEKRRRQTFRK